MNTGTAAPAPGGPGTEPATPRGAGTTTPSQRTAGPPETRGHTGISDRVLEQIAARAVSEVEQVGGVAPRVLGVPLGRDTEQTAPRVSGHVDGHLAILKVTLSVVYPAPIRQVVHRVRDHVVARVRELTGLEARQVDIDVTRLIHPAEEGRRVQ
ncbi:Asp23/Gls24 family envelope stress response protein [Sphaerisporangium perillae]|uniref:Asp23/Gls24 family envelope stress response protein n=1 Tax=Sphaerisporangium perillae TaxID=2935860 RepID=UPI00200C7C59|nr:Asp23/Gls24 family envelope stress response protein [Sphaerisporangium perillae]